MELPLQSGINTRWQNKCCGVLRGRGELWSCGGDHPLLLGPPRGKLQAPASSFRSKGPARMAPAVVRLSDERGNNSSSWISKATSCRMIQDLIARCGSGSRTPRSLRAVWDHMQRSDRILPWLGMRRTHPKPLVRFLLLVAASYLIPLIPAAFSFLLLASRESGAIYEGSVILSRAQTSKKQFKDLTRGVECQLFMTTVGQQHGFSRFAISSTHGTLAEIS
jgi:hypothetical protein